MNQPKSYEFSVPLFKNLVFLRARSGKARAANARSIYLRYSWLTAVTKNSCGEQLPVCYSASHGMRPVSTTSSGNFGERTVIPRLYYYLNCVTYWRWLNERG
jgi:hypothetical protein